MQIRTLDFRGEEELKNDDKWGKRRDREMLLGIYLQENPNMAIG